MTKGAGEEKQMYIAVTGSSGKLGRSAGSRGDEEGKASFAKIPVVPIAM
jgi:hypothetical protein